MPRGVVKRFHREMLGAVNPASDSPAAISTDSSFADIVERAGERYWQAPAPLGGW